MIISLLLTLGLFVFCGVVLTFILLKERRFVFAVGAAGLTLVPLFNLWQGIVALLS